MENGLAVSHAFRAEMLASIRPDAPYGGTDKYGVAIDLGTTKIAGYLLDLRTGATLAGTAAANPQASRGDDVISRITFALQSEEGAALLRGLALEAVDGIITELAERAGLATGCIVRLAVCGNTAMHHLMLGLPVRGLAGSPFRPAVSEAVGLTGEKLGLKSVPGAEVYFLPNIWGYVGGDHVAVLAAVNAAAVERPALIIDIGTNTEISLALPGGITSVSCASGPAFEGGHISRGMKAAPGAIDKITITDGRLKYRTIGRRKAVGICGSGLLDGVAAMLGAGVINAGGRMDRGNSLVHVADGRAEVPLAGGISITQEDVRELQLAKAAIRTGTDALLAHAGMEAGQVRDVIVAGSFGNYIDLNSAILIGMLPPIPRRRFRQVGNAAGAGACLALVSQGARERLEEMAARVHYLELAESPDFMQLFVASMQLD
jgi:uncharacterized 2Fe-2S/4Fe-4S cluster protein (DUF4445 family)